MSAARALALAATGTAALLLVLYLVCVSTNGGTFAYAIDDAYIHLAIARQLVEHGTYGVSVGQPSSASSSIAWPWLLAAGRLVTRSDRLPLLLASLSAAGTVVMAGLHVARSAPAAGAPRAALLGSLLALVVVPLAPVAFTGMEHAAHGLAVLALTMAATSEGRPRALFGLAAVAASLRYETAFVVAPLVLVAWGSRRRMAAAALALGAAAPVLLYGAANSLRGGSFFPTPLLLKRAHLTWNELPAHLVGRVEEAPHVPILLALLAMVLVRAREPADRALATCAITSLLAHLVIAQVGWFYRYEAYAVTLAVVALAGAWRVLRPAPLLTGMALVALGARGLGGVRAVPQASRNVHDQQLQMATFLADAFPGEIVAVNDIGAVAYRGTRVLDLMGLASPRVATAKHMRIDRGISREDLEDITRAEGVRVAVIYDAWFAGAIPPTWERVATWTIPDNHVCAFDTVSFYAVAPSARDELAEKLRRFTWQLPAGVDVRVTRY